MASPKTEPPPPPLYPPPTQSSPSCKESTVIWSTRTTVSHGCARCGVFASKPFGNKPKPCPFVGEPSERARAEAERTPCALPQASDRERRPSGVGAHGGSHRIFFPVAVPSLRSFRFSGTFRYLFCLPKDAALSELYIWIVEPIPTAYAHWFYGALPDNLSGLTVLTICGNTLRAIRRCPQMSHFKSLRELQLLMLGMDMDNLADIYLFLKSCYCSNLERLFVQVSIFYSFLNHFA
ncbi:hypothetical protein PVAP13_4KG392332 [Panicum virgatum]|uniref:Uncharacterized protein n=1 Tax=Panicum virgatum TaxID=38727 RepID=A0A8T0TYP9_PANVG|nr:hypothetical protein PVAP13_4KG392332 [Panicum virgatum]